MVRSGSVIRFLTWKQASQFYGSTVRVEQEQVLYLSARSLSNRKEGAEGQKGVRKTNRISGIWALSKRQGGSMYTSWSTPMKRVYGFREKINLLFWNMNTYGGRKPR